jgi:hypothetical protein
MDQDTYEETRLVRDDWAKFLKEGAICSLLFYSGKVRAREQLLKIDAFKGAFKGGMTVFEYIYITCNTCSSTLAR